MFYWFLKDYQTNVYNADNRKLRSLYPWEIIFLILLIGLSIVWAIVAIIDINSTFNIIMMFVLIALVIFLCFLEENRQKREINKIVDKYKNERLESFLKLLRDKKYLIGDKPMDCIEGIEWLLKACSIELERDKRKPSLFLPVKNFFLTLALPIMTYIGGTISSTLSIDKKFKSAIMLFMIMLILFAIYYMVSPILSELIKSRKRIIEDLEDNLEYYKMVVLINNKQSASI